MTTFTDDIELDQELGLALRRRAMARARSGRPPSPLDAAATELRRARTALSALCFEHAPSAQHLAHAYAFCLSLARELEVLEARGLDPGEEWVALEQLAPAALDTFGTHDLGSAELRGALNGIGALLLGLRRASFLAA